MSGFLYPNEFKIEWDLLIVIYPYITGLVAGAFIVSSLYHVFGITKLKPVARFSLLTALSFLLIAPLPLVIHLGRPERALEMFLRPNLVSAMSGFGFIWLFYFLLVVLEIWLIFRPDIVRNALDSRGLKRRVYSVLALGGYDLSEKALAIDHKVIKVLAAIGIPVACLLHGYVGFIFGAIKANPWWSTPLMPIIFLLSAVVSGIALLIVLYGTSMKLKKRPLDPDCMRTMALWLGGFLTAAFIMEGLEILGMFYEQEESWEIIRQLLTQKIAATYFGLQFGMGAVLPLLVLGISELFAVNARVRTAARFLSASSILIGVFAMRWNVVIGGQLFSKSLRGISDYVPPFFGEGGILVGLIVLVLPFIVMKVVTGLLPPWNDPASPHPVSLLPPRLELKNIKLDGGSHVQKSGW